MGKTKPMGVRFDEELLKEIFEQEKFTTHQGVLNFLENYYKTSKSLNSKINFKPVTKESYEGKKSVLVNQLPNNPKPVRIKGEDGFNYSIRLEEWKEANK